MNLIEQQLALHTNEYKAVVANLRRYEAEKFILETERQALREELIRYIAHRKFLHSVIVVSIKEYRAILSLLSTTQSRLDINTRKLAAIEELIHKEKSAEKLAQERIQYLEKVIKERECRVYQFPQTNS